MSLIRSMHINTFAMCNLHNLYRIKGHTSYMNKQFMFEQTSWHCSPLGGCSLRDGLRHASAVSDAMCRHPRTDQIVTTEYTRETNQIVTLRRLYPTVSDCYEASG